MHNVYKEGNIILYLNSMFKGNKALNMRFKDQRSTKMKHAFLLVMNVALL